MQDDSQVLLHTITAKLRGFDGEAIDANVLYGSGAQVSMIRSNFAKSLSLQNKPIHIVIAKIGRVEEDMCTSL